jgi:hypothetical protein
MAGTRRCAPGPAMTKILALAQDAPTPRKRRPVAQCAALVCAAWTGRCAFRRSAPLTGNQGRAPRKTGRTTAYPAPHRNRRRSVGFCRRHSGRAAHALCPCPPLSMSVIPGKRDPESAIPKCEGLIADASILQVPNARRCEGSGRMPQQPSPLWGGSASCRSAAETASRSGGGAMLGRASITTDPHPAPQGGG